MVERSHELSSPHKMGIHWLWHRLTVTEAAPYKNIVSLKYYKEAMNRLEAQISDLQDRKTDQN